ncbi:MAG: hypothetical protein IPK19_35445 [Chloroflexi bacterium]|nr:hypothetical protein [Chloroflexota bacterium]
MIGAGPRMFQLPLGVDMDGLAILPALVNAHDHLELNHYPRSKFRPCYGNAREWGEDMNVRLGASPFRELRAYPLSDRLFIGGLKNLLCGALTVAHHNPPHKELFRREYPVRVLRRYAWAHSLHFSTEAEIAAALRRIPRGSLFFIHLAEGTDATAAGEYARLDALGGIDLNTVIVHGVGLTPDNVSDAAPQVRALVTCPTTNRFLLGQTANTEAWRAAGGTVWIGSDSRLTADGDLLDEINALSTADESAVVALERHRFHLPGLQHNPDSDWIAMRADAVMPLRRADLALVVREGVPQIGDADLMTQFRDVPSVPATLDGRPKRIHRDLAHQMRRCTLQEAGLTLQ